MDNIKRILILGCSGCGKSTLAKKIGEKYDYPVIHLDFHYWQPGWISMKREAWREKVEELIQGEYWVCDGNYHSTLEIRLNKADLVIYIESSKLKCLWNVLKRYLRYRGKSRPDLNQGCQEQIDLEFIKWIWNFNRKIKPYIFKIFARKLKEKQLHIIKSKREIKALLERIIL